MRPGYEVLCLCRMSLRTFAQFAFWVFLENFNKSSAAFTSTAVVLYESTRAHVRKGGIVSDEKNCIKAKKRSN